MGIVGYIWKLLAAKLENLTGRPNQDRWHELEMRDNGCDSQLESHPYTEKWKI